MNDSKQVGGTHYRIPDQPINLWPYLDPFEATILKYAVRYRRKNGRQDIEKALHYCKLAPRGKLPGVRGMLRRLLGSARLESWCVANEGDLTPRELRAVRILWRGGLYLSPHVLRIALWMLRADLPSDENKE